MKKTIAVLILLLAVFSAGALAEECVLCSGDGICDLCEGKGYLMEDLACICGDGMCDVCVPEDGREFAISPELIGDKGRYTVTWTDSENAGPYMVVRMYQDPSSTVEQAAVFANGTEEASTTDSKELTIDYLIPGDDYVIGVFDNQGGLIEEIISVPETHSFEDGRLTADSVKITIKPSVYTSSTGKTKKIAQLKAAEMMSNMDDGNFVGLDYRIDFPRLAKDRDFFTQLVFYAPNGFSFTEYGQSETYRCFSNASGSYAQWNIIGYNFFYRLYNAAGTVPKGEYSVALYWDGMHVNTSTFMVE